MMEKYHKIFKIQLGLKKFLDFCTNKEYITFIMRMFVVKILTQVNLSNSFKIVFFSRILIINKYIVLLTSLFFVILDFEYQVSIFL